MSSSEFLAWVLILNGFWELRRLWRYHQYGVKDIHLGYRLGAYQLKLLGDKKGARSLLADVTKNWEKHHINAGIIMLLGIPAGIWFLLW